MKTKFDSYCENGIADGCKFCLRGEKIVLFVVYGGDLKKISKEIKGLTKNYFVDKNKKRIIIKMSDVENVYRKTELKIARVLEPPTYNSERLEFSYIGE